MSNSESSPLPPDADAQSRNGAEALMSSLVATDVDVCFMNPGTSEMQFVRALDSVPGMRGVLALFEGVATGAADGYARITGRPAAVLLHLGPGLGNGLANLHNARRAHSPVLCIVGAHATDHVRYDAPLQSDIASVAGTVSGWVHTSGTARGVAADAMRALAATRTAGGQVATLILPADVSWTDGAAVAPARPVPPPSPVSTEVIAAAGAAARKGAETVLLLGGPALGADALSAAGRIAATTGVRVLIETVPARMEAGAGLPAFDRLAYFAEAVEQQLAGTRTLVLVGARAPVSFFAYPGRSSDLVPDGCAVLEVADDAGQDAATALVALADLVAPDSGAPAAGTPSTDDAAPPPEPGPLSPTGLARAVALTLPRDAIVVEEAITSAAALPAALARAARHTLLTLTGGAIGQGLPVATGAAVAAPDRPVLCIEADGSAMYTIQALWTQSRERSDVTTVIINNSAYGILRVEMTRTGGDDAAVGAESARMLDLSDPALDFVHIARGLGVPATRATTTEELVEQLRAAYEEAGPHLIEAIVPPPVP